ncbi:hypothetical protein EXIGUO8A_260006 [Exiguobacterium sp. 8A]|uniref:hypothetical protein n=1 Tax=Exiguobacterium sp. 8A TaxID=2653139 RepID=UPI0012F39003|nr:hypothetical protein [Exiguobacterium sp. 8A]VXB92842.1 hypothetical protein EXIGUO8A_260006 [Exiguobacterium sp. 8A]
MNMYITVYDYEGKQIIDKINAKELFTNCNYRLDGTPIINYLSSLKIHDKYYRVYGVGGTIISDNNERWGMVIVKKL